MTVRVIRKKKIVDYDNMVQWSSREVEAYESFREKKTWQAEAFQQKDCFFMVIEISQAV